MADTMRSIAVLVASAASFFLNLSPALADATAAIIVSIIIAVSLGPLVVGLIKTWKELQVLRREQRLGMEQESHAKHHKSCQHLSSSPPLLTITSL